MRDTPAAMDLQTATSRAKEIAEKTLAPAAVAHDKEASFSKEAIDALGAAGLLGVTLPADAGGGGLGPRAFADVTAILSEADASVGMVYTMHICATQLIAVGAKATGSKALAAA